MNDGVKITGKDLWAAMRIQAEAKRLRKIACLPGYCCEHCPLDGLFEVGKCAEVENVRIEEQAEMLMHVLNQVR